MSRRSRAEMLDETRALLLACSVPSSRAGVAAQNLAYESRDGSPGADVGHARTAYSRETVLDEVCFILGPPMAIGVSVGIAPQAGPLLGAVFLPLGAGWLTRQRDTEPRPSAASEHSPTAGSPLSVLLYPTVLTVAVVVVTLGIIIGTVDVASAPGRVPLGLWEMGATTCMDAQAQMGYTAAHFVLYFCTAVQQ